MAAQAAPTFRFAPSPNGPLHMGHALSALTTEACARACGGRFLLRIEDIDLARTREEYVAGLQADLAWLGLSWEQPVLRQQTRFAAYREAACRLLDSGLLFPCGATRAELETATAATKHSRDPDGAPHYPRTLKRPFNADAIRAALCDESHLARPFALRLDMPRAMDAARAKLGWRPLTFREIGPDGAVATHAATPERWGDAVIVRKEAPASYHLAVVVDDAAQGVTHVTRGEDLRAATGIHRLLQVLLGLPEPVYHHHRLLLAPDGRKLAKSAGSPSLAALRAAGADPAGVKASLNLSVPPAVSAWGQISPFDIKALVE